MVCALGCGGKAAEDSQPAQPSYRAPRATPTAPTASVPQGPQPAPTAPPRQQPPRRPSRPSDPLPPPDLNLAIVENVLAANCGQCHGPALTPTQAQDGINYIDDLDKLVAAGLIVPLSSATSRVIVVMRDGSMPPPASGLPPVTEADIEVVASYIDNPRYWPVLPAPAVVDAGVDTPVAVDAGTDGG